MKSIVTVIVRAGDLCSYNEQFQSFLIQISSETISNQYDKYPTVCHSYRTCID